MRLGRTSSWRESSVGETPSSSSSSARSSPGCIAGRGIVFFLSAKSTSGRTAPNFGVEGRCDFTHFTHENFRQKMPVELEAVKSLFVKSTGGRHVRHHPEIHTATA